MIEINIPFRLPSLNDYIRDCRGVRYAAARIKKETEQKLLLFIRAQTREKIQTPCFIRFTWLEPTRRRDKDNVAFAKKFILDALQKAEVLPNDDNRFVSGFSDSFIYGQGEGVRVSIETRSDDDGE